MFTPMTNEWLTRVRLKLIMTDEDRLWRSSSAVKFEPRLARREELMDRNNVSERLCSAERHELLRRRLPARSVGGAATGQARGASPAGLLLLLLGVWAASWATLASLTSWVR